VYEFENILLHKVEKNVFFTFFFTQIITMKITESPFKSLNWSENKLEN